MSEEDATAFGPDRAPTAVRQLVELAREECLSLLASRSIGRLAVSRGSETPVIRPVNYMFDGRSQAVVFRTSAGSKLSYLARAARAAFEIDEVDPVSRTGWSVIVSGVVDEVTSPLELRRLESLDLDTWPAGERSHWVRIRAETVSGRRITVTERASA